MKTSNLLILACCWSLIAAQANSQDRPPAAPALSIAEELSVDDILEAQHRAVRPNPDRDRLRNMDIVLQISEAGNTLIARYRATADGYMRIDVFSDGTRVYSEGKDPEGVWEWAGGEAQPENVHHDGVAALEHGIEFNLFTLAELKQRGHKVNFIGREIVRGQDTYVLKITLQDGFETFRYVNTVTGLVDASRDFRAFHPGIDDQKKNLETRYDQWQEESGVVTARRSQNIDVDADGVLATTLVLDAIYDVADESLDILRTYVPDSPPM